MTDNRARIDELCINTIRTLAMDAVQRADSGHPGAPMGMAAPMYVLWDRFLRHDPAHPRFADRDRFVLSMGHASMLLYGTLHLTGYDVSLDDIKQFRQLDAKCAGHPESTLIEGVETTTGPLGQGVAVSVGMAIAAKWKAAHFNRPGHEIVGHGVYVFCSDGDMMEGVGSEAASLAGHLGLSNLVWIYDNNGITIDGSTALAFSENVAARFQAYGWFVQRVGDANRLDELHVAIEAARNEPRRPSLVIVDSVIGYGSPNRGGTAKAHGEALGADEVRLAKQFYGWDPDQHFYVPDAVREHMTAGARRRGQELHDDWRRRFDGYAAAFPELADEWRRMHDGRLPDGWDAELPTFAADAKGMATRVAGGKALAAIAKRVPWMMGGSADLAGSNKVGVPDSGTFSRDDATGRNLAFGVREHAMAGVCNGLAHAHVRPFAASFLTFTDYCRPSMRIAALSHLPCVYVFTHDSIGLGEDGPTHQPIEHLASLRAMPNLDVVRPCDANETAVAWRYAMTVKDRPVLLALTRQNVPTLDRTRFAPADGLLKGGYILADCAGRPDVILMGTGSEVHLCVEAADRLAKDGINARVVSLPCWEQFERQSAEYRDHVLPPDVTARVSVEAGATFGWERYIGSRGESIGIDRFGTSAPAEDAFRELGITVDAVVAAARRILVGGGSAARPVGRVSSGASDNGNRKSEPESLNPIQRINRLGQSIWCDSISRAMIDSGELQRLINLGITGMTSNPTIFQKAIANSTDYDERIQLLSAEGRSVEEIYEALAIEDIVDAAELLRPIYDRTNGRDGFISLEVNPHLAHDTEGTIEQARSLWGRVDRPNLMIKVPGTEAGLPAIRTLLSEGINVNVTLIFSLDLYDRVMHAFLDGVTDLAGRGGDATRVASVASFFVSRVDTLADKKLQQKIDGGRYDLRDLPGKAAIGNAKMAYQRFKSVFDGPRFAELRRKGAAVQRPLWASTSTKNPNYPDTYYVDNLIGPDTVNTIPLDTIGAVHNHATPALTIDSRLNEYVTAITRFDAAGLSMSEVTDELLTAGVKAFADSFEHLMADIRAKIAALQAV